MHCILPEAGTALNIIPERCTAEVMIRSTELDYLEQAGRSIENCAAGAAAATGCEFKTEKIASVKPVLFNQKLFDLAHANAVRLGETLDELPLWEASSDFGDVSRELPSMSILYRTHESGICWHSRDTAEAAAGDAALDAMIRAAKILAMTVIDLIKDGSK